MASSPLPQLRAVRAGIGDIVYPRTTRVNMVGTLFFFWGVSYLLPIQGRAVRVLTEVALSPASGQQVAQDGEDSLGAVGIVPFV